MYNTSKNNTIIVEMPLNGEKGTMGQLKDRETSSSMTQTALAGTWKDRNVKKS